MQQCTVVAVELYGVEVLMWKGTRNSTNAQLSLPRGSNRHFEPSIILASTMKDMQKFRLNIADKCGPFKYRKYCSGPGYWCCVRGGFKARQLSELQPGIRLAFSYSSFRRRFSTVPYLPGSP